MQYINQFKRYLETLGYHELTVKGHLYAVAKYLKWQEETGKQPNDYKLYLESKPNERYGGGISISSIYSNLKSVELYYTYQLNMNIIEKHPLSNLTLPKRQYANKKVASENEIQSIYKACNTYLERCLLSIFYGCGLRRNEGLNLVISDVNFSESYLIVREGKGAKRRVVPMSKGVVRDIKNYLHYERLPQDYSNQNLLLNTKGTSLKNQVANNYFKAIVKRSECAYLLSSAHLHWLRFLLGCHLLNRGMSIEEIQKILGHSSIETTGKYYTRVNQNRINEL